jgi:hypothetical protein
MAVFWDVTSCTLADADQRFRITYCCLIRDWWWRQLAPLKRRPVSIRLHGATSQRLSFSYSSLWEHEISTSSLLATWRDTLYLARYPQGRALTGRIHTEVTSNMSYAVRDNKNEHVMKKVSKTTETHIRRNCMPYTLINYESQVICSSLVWVTCTQLTHSFEEISARGRGDHITICCLNLLRVHTDQVYLLIF